MTATTVLKKPRPLSPHLQVYRPQITSVLSILHRLTGVGLSFAMPVFVWFLVALSQGKEPYEKFLNCAHSIPGQIVLFGWVWAFCYHLCCGIRHLFWDSGSLLEIKQVNASGAVAVFVSSVMTIGVYLCLPK